MITAEIVGSEETTDGMKNIIIWVCFKQQDGSEIPFYRGAELLIKNGKKVWPLYARYENFLGKTPTAISEWIQKNVESHIGTIIREINAKSDLNASFIGEIVKLTGTTFSKDTVEIPVDTLNTGTPNAVIILKDDKTYTVK